MTRSTTPAAAIASGSHTRVNLRITPWRAGELLGRAAGQSRPRQGARSIAPDALGGRTRDRRWNLRRRRGLGAEHVLLGATLEEGLELLLLDLLALDEDLGEPLQRVALLREDLLGLHMRGLDDAADLVV